MDIGAILVLILILLIAYIYMAKKLKTKASEQLQDDTVTLQINMNRRDMCDFYDFVQWSDKSNDIPIHHLNKNTKKTWWAISEKTPEKNEHRVVCISLPTAKGININTKFWCLYSPALSAINGLGEFPEEIAQSGLVLCRVLEYLETTNEGYWFVVNVVDLKLFDAAIVDIDINQESVDLKSIELFENYHNVKCKDLIYVSNYANESHIGNEFVIQKQDGRYHLICYMGFSYCFNLKENYSTAWYGNSVLSDESLKKLNL